MRSDRTSLLLVALALILSLLVGLSVGSGGPVVLIRSLYNAVVSPFMPPPPPTATPTVTIAPTPQSAATAPPVARAATTVLPSPTRRATATAEPTATPAPSPTALPTLAVATQGRVNVRAAPSDESEVLGVLDAGTEVTAIGRAQDSQWLRVLAADDLMGWITASTSLVTVDGDITTLPIVE